MRKATIRIVDKVIEIDISDEWARELLGLSTSIIEPKTESGFNKSSVQRLQKNTQAKLDKWKLLVEAPSDRRGREGLSKYRIYSSNITDHIMGIRDSESGTTQRIQLGRPSNNSSRISQIIKAVSAMPYHEPFTRRQLSESLPATVAKGDILKVALEYIEYMGRVRKLKEREIGSGAIQYQRREDIRNPNDQIGSEVVGVSYTLNNAEQ